MFTEVIHQTPLELPSDLPDVSGSASPLVGWSAWRRVGRLSEVGR